MEARPKIKIALTQSDKIFEIGGIVLLAIMWALALINYFQSPETVAIHFDFSGHPDGYGNKLTNFLLTLIATIIYLGLTQLNKYPHFFNYMTKLTEENAARQYTGATKMIRILKISIVLIFTIEILSALLMTLGIFNGIGIWSLPLTILILAVPVIYAISQSLNK